MINQPKWLLFNDFLVKEVSADEALSCAPAWKVSLCRASPNTSNQAETYPRRQSPALIVLERADAEQVMNLENLPKQIDPTILVRDSLISG